MQSAFVHGKTWYDKTYGNSYFSARIFVDGVEVARLPFQYGYGDQYIHEAQRALQRLGILAPEPQPGLRLQIEASGAVFHSVLEQSRRRDVEGWGKPWVTA